MIRLFWYSIWLLNWLYQYCSENWKGGSTGYFFSTRETFDGPFIIFFPASAACDFTTAAICAYKSNRQEALKWRWKKRQSPTITVQEYGDDGVEETTIEDGISVLKMNHDAIVCQIVFTHSYFQLACTYMHDHRLNFAVCVIYTSANNAHHNLTCGCVLSVWARKLTE